MASSIQFTDEVGAVTLTNGVPAPGDRFAGWTNRRRVVGPRETSLATGQLFRFPFRQERIATFTLPNIPMASLATVSRLIEWLEGGGTVTVNTGDNASRSYTTVGLAEGAEVELSQTDAAALFYALTLTVVNLDPANADLTCDYTDE